MRYLHIKNKIQPYPTSIELGLHDTGGATSQRCEQNVDDAMDVVQGKNMEDSVHGRPLPALDHASGHCCQIAMGHHNSLATIMETVHKSTTKYNKYILYYTIKPASLTATLV